MVSSANRLACVVRPVISRLDTDTWLRRSARYRRQPRRPANTVRQRHWRRTVRPPFTSVVSATSRVTTRLHYSDSSLVESVGCRGHRRRSRGGTGPPNDGVGGAPCTLGPPTLTPADRNKTYCFHELVLNLPAPLDIQWPKCFQLQGGFAP